MNVYRVIAVAKKEWIHILRDWRSLAMAILMPVLLIFLFGSSLRLDVDHVALTVWDQSNTPESRDYIGKFSASRYFMLTENASSYADVDRVMDERTAVLALVIPTDFARGISGGHPVKVQLIADGSDDNTATIAIAYAQAITDEYNGNLLIQMAHKKGMKEVDATLKAEPRVWFNQEMQAKNYIIPGLIAVIMMAIAALLTSLTVAREWENGTMEQLLTTPLRPIECIAGKLLPYFAIGMLDIFFAMLMGQFLFDVPLRGNPALIFGAGAIFLAGSLTLGMLISIMTRSQLLASQLAIVLTFLPSFLLSGFMYTISNMPAAIQGLTYLVPARYFVTILKNVYLKGAGISVLAAELLILLFFAVVLMAAAHFKLRKRLV